MSTEARADPLSPTDRNGVAGKPDARRPHVAVCACTYRRPDGLRALLEGVAAQGFRDRRPQLTVVVADNEGSEAARGTCRAFGARTGIPVVYVHEPRRGIPAARNTLLDNLPAGCDFVAMLDDDEVPEPGWLERLLVAQAETGADVVHGPVVPVLPEGAPAWIGEGGFFGWPRRSVQGRLRRRPDRAVLGSAATNNVLFRADVVRRHGVRFDTALGLTGVDDAVFFRALRRLDCRIVWAADATVRETIPPERARFGYLWRLAWRDGSNTPLKKGLGKGRALSWPRRVRLALRGLTEASLSVASPLLPEHAALSVRCRLAIGAFRLAAGLGLIAGALGSRYEHYR